MNDAVAAFSRNRALGQTDRREMLALATEREPTDRVELGADDPALVARCRDGDPEALTKVFRAHAPYLERLLRRVMGPSADIDDLLQNTFIGAISAFPRFRGEAAVRTWLSRIAVRTAINARRKPERKRPHLSLVPAQHGGTVSPDYGGAVDERRCLERVYAILRALGVKKQTAFALHVFEGHSLEEVAALTGASRAAVKSQVFWARRSLLKQARKDPLLRDWLAQLEEPR